MSSDSVEGIWGKVYELRWWSDPNCVKESDMCGRLLVTLLWMLASNSRFPWSEGTFLLVERVDEQTYWWHRENGNFPCLMFVDPCIIVQFTKKIEQYYTWQRPATTRPITVHVCKTRGCLYSFRLLMMGGVSPETCWASYKYEIKILVHCCTLLDFLCELWSKFKVCKSVHYHTIPINQPTRCNNFPKFITWRLCTVQHISGVLTPIIRSSKTAVAASGFTVGALLPPRSNGKTRGCYCSFWAPDDGRENARNMLSHT
jgi:hypothetical protein